MSSKKILTVEEHNNLMQKQYKMLLKQNKINIGLLALNIKCNDCHQRMFFSKPYKILPPIGTDIPPRKIVHCFVCRSEITVHTTAEEYFRYLEYHNSFVEELAAAAKESLSACFASVQNFVPLKKSE